MIRFLLRLVLVLVLIAGVWTLTDRLTAFLSEKH